MKKLSVLFIIFALLISFSASTVFAGTFEEVSGKKAIPYFSGTYYYLHMYSNVVAKDKYKAGAYSSSNFKDSKGNLVKAYFLSVKCNLICSRSLFNYYGKEIFNYNIFAISTSTSGTSWPYSSSWKVKSTHKAQKDKGTNRYTGTLESNWVKYY